MDISKPDVKSIYASRIDSNPAKVLSTQICRAKPENGKYTTASVHLNSIQTAKFRLLSLPIELRRIIYRYYFNSPLDGWKSNYRLLLASEYCNIFCLKKCDTQILWVNHQIYEEAIEVLYGDAVWHFSFNSFESRTAHRTVHGTFLRQFRSRPEFRFIRNVTIGVMFRTVMNVSFRTLENSNRLRINQKLLRKICEVLCGAPKLRTVKLLWHDKVDCEDWEEKQTCLSSLAKLPEHVRCMVFLGQESMAVHFSENSTDSRQGFSTQEELAKTNLNKYLEVVRREYQASARHKLPEGLEETSTQNTIEQSCV